MDYSGNNQNHHYQRDRTPYERDRPRNHGGNFRPHVGTFMPQGESYRPQEEGYNRPHEQSFRQRSENLGRQGDNSRFHGNQSWGTTRGTRSSHSRGNYHNSSRSNQDRWQNSERTFDERGRQVGNRENPYNHHQNSSDCNYSFKQTQQSEEVPALTMLIPLEEKAKDFLHTVLRQEGIRSKLIFLETVESPLQTLQGTVDYCQLQMTVEQDSLGDFVMKIDKEEVGKGTFPTKQAAKTALAEQVMEVLRKDCFYIIKKKVYEEVTTKKGEPKVETQSQAEFQGSKAHQMMLKMGWGGKGLGVNEQGAEKTVAETLDQNVSRQGLGTDDVFKKIHKLLEDYSKSDKITLLRFDPDFTSEERAHIHKMAQKFGLKSKSEGKGEQRRITITKKLHRGDLVYNLLSNDLENTLYKLIIPAKFLHLWNDDEDD